MRPVDFEGSNKTFTKPNTMTDEECLPLRAYVKTDDLGRTTNIVTVWQPSKEDIEAIMDGSPIIVSIVGGILPPMALYTEDKEGNLNT